MSVFVLHKSVPFNTWLEEKAMEEHCEERAHTLDEFKEKMMADDPENWRLDPADFEAHVNPRVIGETEAQEWAWEFCLSFP